MARIVERSPGTGSDALCSCRGALGISRHRGHRGMSYRYPDAGTSSDNRVDRGGAAARVRGRIENILDLEKVLGRKTHNRLRNRIGRARSDAANRVLLGLAERRLVA